MLKYESLGKGCRLAQLPIKQLFEESRYRSNDWSYHPDVPPPTRSKAERRPIRTDSPLCDVCRSALEYFAYVVGACKACGLRPKISNSLKLSPIIVSCTHSSIRRSPILVIFAYFLPRM